MSVTITIQVLDCGADTNAYNLYYDYVAGPYLLAENVPCEQLRTGYILTGIPSSAANIIVTGIGLCTDSFTIPITATTPTPTPTPGTNCTFQFIVNIVATPTPTPTTTPF